jgi:hypothetical protein
MTLRTDVNLIDTAIDEMSEPSESQCELLREHLESARHYLLGSMEKEYVLSLQLAKQALNCISDADRKRRMEKLIADMLAEA